MDEQVFPMSRHSSVREPDCSPAGEQVHLLRQAVKLQETVRNFHDTVSSLEPLRCTDLKMQGVLLGLEKKRTADGCNVDAFVKENHSKGPRSKGTAWCKKCDKKGHCA